MTFAIKEKDGDGSGTRCHGLQVGTSILPRADQAAARFPLPNSLSYTPSPTLSATSMSRGPMRVTRPTLFWVSIAVLAIVMLVLLHEILMPFLLGMVSAYLLVPIVDSLERAGLNRSFAAVMLVLLLLVGFVAVILVIMPFLLDELRFFIASFPAYVTRVQALLTD